MRASAFAAGLGLLVLGSASCADDDLSIKPQGDRCALNSECIEPMVCGFERCRPQCETSRDCGGRRCVRSSGPTNVCQLEDEATCTHNSECPGEQICARDLKCRDACITEKDCVGEQACVESVCADRTELQPDGTLAAGPPPSGVACTYATECPDTLVCLNGICAIECVEDKDCFVTWACFKQSVGGDGRCYPRAALPDGSAPDASAADGGDAGGVVLDPISFEAGCQVLANGTAKCWDYSERGNVADAPPELVPNLTNVVSLVGNQDIRYALLADGTLRYFGPNLRNPVADYELQPTPVPALVGITRISSFVDGRVVAENALRQSWIYRAGDPESQVGATQHTGLLRAFGRQHVLLGSGDVRSFTPTATSDKGLTNVVDVTAFAHLEAMVGNTTYRRESACAVLGNGTLTCWGGVPEGFFGGGVYLGGEYIQDQPTPVAVDAVPNAAQVSSNGTRVCARRENGEIFCWCAQENSEVCNVTTPQQQTDASQQPVLARTLARHSTVADLDSPMCVVRLDGIVECAFYNESFVPVPSLAGAIELYVAHARVYARMSNGALKVWKHRDDVTTDIPL